MTVESTANRVEYVGNGVTVAFGTAPVVFFDASELEVYVVITATGASTLQTITTDYTVSGGDGATGTVTMVLAPASVETLVIVRTVPLTQTTDFVNNDPSDAEVIETALDRLTMAAQQADAQIVRSIVIPASDVAGTDTELPVAGSRASKYLFFGVDGSVGVTPGAGSAVPISAFMATVVDDASANAAVQTLVAALTAETAPATDDVVVLGDTSEGAGNKMTLANLLKVLNSLTTDNLPIGSTDFGLTYDTSAAAVKKVLLGEYPLPMMQISGFTYSNNGADPTNDLDIAAGSCRDATDATNMRRTSSITKQLDAAWVVGTNQGGLDTGSVGNSDYYMWSIKRSDTGVVDVLYSLSSTAPSMPTSYDYKRLIGWFRRVGGTIVAFTTYETEGGGLEVLWTSPTLDIDLAATLTTARRTDAVKVPLNFSTTALLNVFTLDATTHRVWIYCPDQADLAPAVATTPLAIHQGVALTNEFSNIRVRTSAAGLIAARADIAGIDNYRVSTLGFQWARRN